MEYLAHMKRSIENAASVEKLDRYAEMMQDTARGLGLSSALRVLAEYERMDDIEDKRDVLWRAADDMNETIDCIKVLEDDMSFVMDADDKADLEARRKAEIDSAHAKGGITFGELDEAFTHLPDGSPMKTAIIVFRPTSTLEGLDEEHRSFRITSDNKAFNPHAGGYSLFGTLLSNPTEVVRLDLAMRDEDKESRWVVDYCKIE